MENVRKHRGIRFVTTGSRNYFVSEPNYHTTKFFMENLLAIEMRKAETCVFRTFYILKLSKILVYEFWYMYDYVCDYDYDHNYSMIM